MSFSNKCGSPRAIFGMTIKIVQHASKFIFTAFQYFSSGVIPFKLCCIRSSGVELHFKGLVQYGSMKMCCIS